MLMDKQKYPFFPRDMAAFVVDITTASTVARMLKRVLIFLRN